jgi:hypothetical protein
MTCILDALQMLGFVKPSVPISEHLHPNSTASSHALKTLFLKVCHGAVGNVLISIGPPGILIGLLDPWEREQSSVHRFHRDLAIP